jgi:YbgC/YbaW family acyl-CoA thioester hydrolase
MNTFRTHRRIEFGDTDMAGIVHFSNFFRYMEAAETEFLRSRGLSVAWIENGLRVGFPRVSAACDYKKPVFFEEIIDIDVTLENVGSKSVTYRFDFSRGGDAIASGRITGVFCREVAGHGLKSEEIPESIRSRLSE